MKLRESLGLRVSSVPLRIGLVVAMVGLAALVLMVSGVALTSALSRSLTSRTDEQLYDAARSWALPRAMKQIQTDDGHTVWVPADAQRPPNTGRLEGEQPRRYFELRKGPDGQVYSQVAGGDSSTPDLDGYTGSTPATVGSTAGSTTRWRVLTVTNKNGSTTIGVSLADNLQTVSGLIYFELATGATALLLLGIGGYLVVRRSLRPLRQVEETAAAIAGGDLHRRVPVRGVDTEVDHLARSLNEMLAQIQHGVAATEASEEAARRSEAKMRRFIADASHELRTPLTTIRGFAELYRQGASTDAAGVLTRIENEASRMGLLVEDLLMLARVDANRPLARKPVDLLLIAGDTVHNAQAIAARQKPAPEGPDRSIRLEVLPGEGTLQVIGDETRLRQVLTNLVGNALTHTPVQAPITVRLTPFPDEVRVDVVDGGPGLSPESAARVFERFYRTDASRTRASGGTGLGLSIVQALVVAHGGQVTLDTVPGEGATFTVCLPRTL
ncbi:MAG: two-component sensor histidine kinase [Nocardia sp.]|uniref:sensor histidine kinase n=1 Tax=Nocardia sp. TaxID=1821 RepID=UPI002623F8C6|nr:HAMP domain-containing sensor histidine kinase [Nocardia sp.]MCU1642778.1 two-component sensor histidine kinase [Nocardia sp.]